MTNSEIIREVAEKVMGWKLEPFPTDGFSQPEGKAFLFCNKVRLYHREYLVYFDPLNNANHTLMVIERMVEDRKFNFKIRSSVSNDGTIHYTAAFYKGHKTFGAGAKNINEINLAVCLAALKAVEEGK